MPSEQSNIRETGREITPDGRLSTGYERDWWDEESGYRVLVETERGGTVELLAEANRVVVRIEHGDRVSSFSLTPGGASNIGRRLQGAAKHAQECRS